MLCTALLGVNVAIIACISVTRKTKQQIFLATTICVPKTSAYDIGVSLPM